MRDPTGVAEVWVFQSSLNQLQVTVAPDPEGRFESETPGTNLGARFEAEWPDSERWALEGVMRLEPWWINFFENTATVQFTHRALGIGLVVLTLWLWLRIRAAKFVTKARRLVELLAAIVTAQAALGVATLISEVPVALGVAHQAGAVVSFTVAIWVVYELKFYPSAVTDTRRTNRAAPSR